MNVVAGKPFTKGKNWLISRERFNITNGPELHACFIIKEDLVNSQDLGILKGNIGAQILR